MKFDNYDGQRGIFMIRIRECYHCSKDSELDCQHCDEYRNIVELVFLEGLSECN